MGLPPVVLCIPFCESSRRASSEYRCRESRRRPFCGSRGIREAGGVSRTGWALVGTEVFHRELRLQKGNHVAVRYQRAGPASRQSVGFEVLKKFSTATATLASFNFQGGWSA